MKVVVGLSAHDNGIAVSVAAYMLGARVVEKHFTLNRTMRGTDHAFSLEPVGLTKLVRDLIFASDKFTAKVMERFRQRPEPALQRSRRAVN